MICVPSRLEPGAQSPAQDKKKRSLAPAGCEGKSGAAPSAAERKSYVYRLQ